MVEVLKFWAPWCRPCTALSVQLKGLELTSINIDEDEEQIAKKYRIRSIPMLVFLKDGEEVHREAGITSKSKYLEILQGLQDGE